LKPLGGAGVKAIPTSIAMVIAMAKTKVKYKKNYNAYKENQQGYHFPQKTKTTSKQMV
jgi:hypothetical protein